MEGNPYARFWEAFNNPGAGLIPRQGSVLRVSPHIEINVKSKGGGITVSGTELMINADLSLTAGENVLLLTEDDQLYFVLCKVVSG